MNSKINNPLTRAVVEQITNNTISWIGHQKIDNKDVIGGQTFIAPAEADLEAIEVFTSIVTTPGSVLMTMHSFDSQLKSWGPVLGSASVDFNKVDNGKWKTFKISGLHLNKGKTYGFRLESPNSYIGVGETVGSYPTPPLFNGQEWRFTKNDEKGHSFSYFSLAFKVDVRA
ncbi:MAG: hypothetical protein H7Z13_14715 [Ferruginibacter sp.]|nr:hypothetical protein [Ferruginibacter sp.]